MRRSNLFLALTNQHDIDGQLPAGGANGVQRRKEGRFRAFLVDGAAAHDRPAETGSVDNGRLERRRGPFRGIELLDVIHEIDAERTLGAGVQSSEDAGMTIGWHDLDMLEPGVCGQTRHKLCALGHIAVFGCDRGGGRSSLGCA
jgi:hypothetical protein